MDGVAIAEYGFSMDKVDHCGMRSLRARIVHLSVGNVVSEFMVSMYEWKKPPKRFWEF